MKKIIALSVLSLTVLLATGCGTTETETTETKTAELGSCMISMNGSCQDFENLVNYTVETLKQECEMVGVWNESKCPAEYSNGCKSTSTGLNGGTYDVSILYKTDDSFLSNYKSGCTGEWLEK